MIKAILLVCSVANPHQCHEETFPSERLGQLPFACLSQAAVIAAEYETQWLEKGFRVARISCGRRDEPA